MLTVLTKIVHFYSNNDIKFCLVDFFQISEKSSFGLMNSTPKVCSRWVIYWLKANKSLLLFFFAVR